MFERLKELWKILFGSPVCPICGKDGSRYIPGGYCVDCDIKRIEKMAEILSKHKAELDELPPEKAGKVIDQFIGGN